MINLTNTDCLKHVRSIKDNSIDLVVVDPPYFIGYDGGKGWDSAWKTEKEYLDWCNLWTAECVRVLKPNRMLVAFGTLKTNSFIKYKLQTEENSQLTPQNELIWSYNWGGRSKTNFARKHEYAWCWSKGSSFLFNADDVRIERKQKSNPRTGEEYAQGTIPTCVWEKNNHTMSKEFCKWHPTQKPLEILDRIIRGYTNPGDTVLDLFSGSGSTAIAATNAKRHFTGCEFDTEYFTKSLVRIRELT